MEVEVTIIIKVKKENFNKSELRSDILDSFEERTGYEVHQLDIESEE